MMREPVVIVLNEREPAKLRAAEELHSALAQYSITASRVEITEDIVAILKSRNPKVLVLDYLLGDYSTGPDVMSAFNSVKSEKRPRFFFLTDEPSVQVAVNALLNGARNYLELENTDSVKKLAAEIYDCLKNEKSLERAVAPPSLALDELIAGADCARKTHEQIQSAAARRVPIMLLYGPPGSGISTLCRAAALECNNGSFLRIIDLRYFTDSLAEQLGIKNQAARQLCLGENLFLIAEHIDQDGGELLELLYSMQKRLWPDGKASALGSRVVAATNDKETAVAWRNMLKAELIKVPALSERVDDIAPMIQRFAMETEEISGRKVKPVSPDIIRWLASLNWPGNIRELRSCVVDGLARSFISDQPIKALLEESRDIAQLSYDPPQMPALDPLVAASVLEMNNMSYRVAAAKLGISVRALYDCINNQVAAVQ